LRIIPAGSSVLDFRKTEWLALGALCENAESSRSPRKRNAISGLYSIQHSQVFLALALNRLNFFIVSPWFLHFVPAKVRGNDAARREQLFPYLIKLAPQIIAAAFALVYVSGFLCQITFLDRFGIHDITAELWRAKYIHTGILFLLFPVAIVIPLALKVSLKNTEVKQALSDSASPVGRPFAQSIFHTIIKAIRGNPSEQFKFPLVTMASFFNISIVFYLLIFTPGDFFQKHEHMMALIVVLSFIGPKAIDIIFKHVLRSELFGGRYLARWFLVLAPIIWMDSAVFAGLRLYLLNILKRGFWYIIFVLMVPYAIARANHHARKLQNPRSKMEARFIGIFLGLMFYFLATVSFTFRIYPFIPIARGGGDFTESPSATFVFTDKIEPSRVLGTNGVSSQYIVIEQSPTSIFVANRADSGGPAQWRDMQHMPNLIEIRKMVIDGTIYRHIPSP
jgi:hypothetical protein